MTNHYNNNDQGNEYPRGSSAAEQQHQYQPPQAANPHSHEQPQVDEQQPDARGSSSSSWRHSNNHHHEQQPQPAKPRMQRQPSKTTTTTKPKAKAKNAKKTKEAKEAPAAEDLNEDSIYDFYTHQLWPALASSLPILLKRLAGDVQYGMARVLYLILPSWSTRSQRMNPTLSSSFGWLSSSSPSSYLADGGNKDGGPIPTLHRLWEEYAAAAATQQSSMNDAMMRHLDLNGDGHIESSELLHLGEMLRLHMHETLQETRDSWWKWLSREWPLMDWKLGVFLWHTCSGVLLLCACASIVPGKLHGWTAQVLRWPVLALVYFLILVELIVYIVIRLFIRLAEAVVARPRHRHLRKAMRASQSYEEWYKYAAALDKSQKRDVWLRQVHDETSARRYNWAFIKALMADMRAARTKNDSLLALAVIQQCTRKNVGGIMSGDLFQYSNTGEPKQLVREFVHEVVTTMYWVTNHAIDMSEEQRRLQKLEKKQQQQQQQGDKAAHKELLNGNKNNNTDKNRQRHGSHDEEVSSSTSTISSSDSCSNEDPNVAAAEAAAAEQERLQYEDKMKRKVDDEKDKLWRSLVSFLIPGSNNGNNNNTSSSHGNAKSPAASPTVTQRKDSSGSAGNQQQQKQQQEQQLDLTAKDAAPTTKDKATEQNIPQVVTGPQEQNPPTVTAPPAPTASSLPQIHREEVLQFLKRARAAYGRTALCLSGGAMMGNYHFGHVMGLIETGCLPHIISGTSAGSIIASIICTRTDEELRHVLQPQNLSPHLSCFARPWSERLKSVLTTGNMFSFEDWMERIKWFTCGDMTFLEAYKKTGRVFCITLSSTTKKAPPVLLNYLSAPHVTIASAVLASAAVPGFIPPVRLQYKDANGVVKVQGGDKDQTYFDGSIEQDIPVAGLAEMLNCQFFIAAQCNPHIVPFFYDSKGAVGRPSRWSSGTQEDSWRGGFLLAALEMYLKNDMKAKFVFLKDLEASVGFTSTLMTQEFVGSTTIVPQVAFTDYFKLFSDPTLDDLYHYYQGGTVAAYEHVAMIKLHYSIADALDECIARLENKGHRRNRRGGGGAAATSVKRRAMFSIPEIHRPKAFIEENAKPPRPPGEGLHIRNESDDSDDEDDDAGIWDNDNDNNNNEDEYEREWIGIDD